MSDQAAVDRRLLLWALQAQARHLLASFGKLERVTWCLRRLSVDPDTKKSWRTVHVMFSESVQRAHFKHLAVCGSVWMCPICSAKISERRRIELTEAVDRCEFQLLLSTFTLQHSGGERVSTVLDAWRGAYKFLTVGRRWQEFKNDYGLVGSVRSLETTFGDNGPHPHGHTLQFFKPGKNLHGVESAEKSLWRDSLEHSSRSASWSNGVDVRSAAKDIVEYVSKFGREPVSLKRPRRWSMEHELTKSQSKLSKGEHGRTPLQLLADSMGWDGLRIRPADSAAGPLWVEYALAFKGKRQLYWSHGLRALLGLGTDRSDLEIALQEDQSAFLLAELSLHQWGVILANDARGDVLEVASTGDRDQLQKFLKSIGAL